MMSITIDNNMTLLSGVILKNFVCEFLKRKQIFCDAVREFGSPLYILEEGILKERAQHFKTALNRELPKSEFYFAMKSNNLPYISEVLLKEGFGLDVSSGLELETALSLGARRILFSGPGKTNAELELTVDNSDTITVLVDSLGELRRLNLIAALTKKIVNIGLRLNNNPDGLWKKFGISIDKLESIYTELAELSHVKFTGLQFHSSWNLDPKRQIDFIRIIGQKLKSMPDRFNEELEFIDIGGGYWPSQGEWLISEDPLLHYCLPASPIEVFALKLSKALQENIFPVVQCKIYLEPGRWICNDSMHILMSVVDYKNKGLVITDAGTNAIGWERFETDYFPVINLTQMRLEEKACNILGSLCTPHDVWGYAYFGSNISEEDILMIPNQGAYTYSLRQQFIKPLPKTIVIKESKKLFCLNCDKII